MDPALHSPTGDAFRSGSGKVVATVLAPDKIAITFPAPVAGLDEAVRRGRDRFCRSRRRKRWRRSARFMLRSTSRARTSTCSRNPNYWKHDAAGRQLPYLDAVKLEIQANRDIEFVKFTRNEIHLINAHGRRLLRPAVAHRRRTRCVMPGPSLDSEQMWFNQVPSAPIPAYKREWFKSRNFRLAISSAINRDDLCKVVYKGHASPALGPVSPANKFWFDARLQPVPLRHEPLHCNFSRRMAFISRRQALRPRPATRSSSPS